MPVNLLVPASRMTDILTTSVLASILASLPDNWPAYLSPCLLACKTVNHHPLFHSNQAILPAFLPKVCNLLRPIAYLLVYHNALLLGS